MAESYEKRVTESEVHTRRLYLHKNATYAAIVSNLSSRRKEILAKGEEVVELPAVDASTGKLYFVKLRDTGYGYSMYFIKDMAIDGIFVAGKTVVFKWNNNNDSLEIYH